MGPPRVVDLVLIQLELRLGKLQFIFQVVLSRARCSGKIRVQPGDSLLVALQMLPSSFEPRLNRVDLGSR